MLTTIGIVAALLAACMALAVAIGCTLRVEDLEERLARRDRVEADRRSRVRPVKGV